MRPSEQLARHHSCACAPASNPGVNLVNAPCGHSAGSRATTNQEFEPMRRGNFALRQPSWLEELRKAAELEGVALNQLINAAVAEKVSALRTEKYFRER